MKKRETTLVSFYEEDGSEERRISKQSIGSLNQRPSFGRTQTKKERKKKLSKATNWKSYKAPHEKFIKFMQDDDIEEEEL